MCFASVYSSATQNVCHCFQWFQTWTFLWPPLKSYLRLLTPYDSKWGPRTNSIGTFGSFLETPSCRTHSRPSESKLHFRSPGNPCARVSGSALDTTRCSSYPLSCSSLLLCIPVCKSSGSWATPLTQHSHLLPPRAWPFDNSTPNPQVPRHLSSPEVGKPNTSGLCEA